MVTGVCPLLWLFPVFLEPGLTRRRTSSTTPLNIGGVDIIGRNIGRDLRTLIIVITIVFDESRRRLDNFK